MKFRGGEGLWGRHGLAFDIAFPADLLEKIARAGIFRIDDLEGRDLLARLVEDGRDVGRIELQALRREDPLVAPGAFF